MKLYSMGRSGNCYKAELTASLLGLPLDLINVDVVKRETRGDAFLKLNPNGKVPLLELDDGRLLPESNAIIHYLAHGTPLIPQDRFEHAVMLQWMFFEQYSHEPYIAVARYWWSIAPGGREEKADRFAEWHRQGNAALGVMNGHLTGRDFLAGDRISLADIALYAYTHVAGEGGFDLAPYGEVRDWLKRVADRPGYIPIRPYEPSP